MVLDLLGKKKLDKKEEEDILEVLNQFRERDVVILEVITEIPKARLLVKKIDVRDPGKYLREDKGDAWLLEIGPFDRGDILVIKRDLGLYLAKKYSDVFRIVVE